MGLEMSTKPMPEATLDKTWFSFSRILGYWPTQYDELKTPVTVDVLQSGLALAFVMLAFCFYIVLPGIRGKERVYCFIRITVSLFLGACVLLCNWGQEWEVHSIETETQYKAYTADTIKAKVGIKIGLRNVNITLKGLPEVHKGERINYNERFWWSFPWAQGRIGFGPYAAEVNQEFRAAQQKGLPYPILWIAESFTLDGEDIQWGRRYRTAGWYTHIMEWTAFCCWLLANVLYFMNPRLGAYMTMIMGGFLLVGNILWASIRNSRPLVIPFDRASLEPEYGWCFWLNLTAGLLSVLIGAVIVILDMFTPDALATFFGVDILKDYEEFYPETDDAASLSSQDVGQALKNGENAEAPPAGAHPRRRSTIAVPQLRKRGFSFRSQKRPVAPPRIVKSELPYEIGYNEEEVELTEYATELVSVHKDDGNVAVVNVAFEEE